MNAEHSTLRSPAERYLDLLKKSLTFTLWPEPPMPLDYFTANFNSEPTPVRGWIVSTIARLLRTRRFHLMKELPATWAERRDGENWPYYAETMMGLTRLNHLQQCVQTVIRESIPGDLIETGVWRGGGCIFMRGVLAAHGVSDRRVFVADSFKGFPPPEATPDAGNDTFPPYLAVSEDQVRENFRRYSLLDEQVVFLTGWFKDTLPTAPVERLAILRLDGDMYGSTMDALTALYPKLSPGGFCIIDDYGAFDVCRQAVRDYRDVNGITAPIETIDWTGAFWRK